MRGRGKTIPGRSFRASGGGRRSRRPRSPSWPAPSALEAEYRDARVLDRRIAFALHRLAFEAQVLHTDAWPGLFDEWTVDTLRAVQEAVERILSGQDIRYFPADPPPEDLR